MSDIIHHPDGTRRPIVVELHRSKEIVRKTPYSRLDTAIPRTTQRMMTEGKVGDLAVVYHADTGLELGTVKMNARGELRSKWIWDEEEGK